MSDVYAYKGGHIEANESAKDAAFREFYEEIGINAGNIHYLGHGETLPAITGTLVAPIIAYLEEDVYDFEKCTPSEDEVDQIFTVSLETLLSPGYWKTEIFSRNDSSTYRRFPDRAPSFSLKTGNIDEIFLATKTQSCESNSLFNTRKFYLL